MSTLASYDGRPGDLTKEIAETVSAIVEIVGKTTRTVFNGLSLLKNTSEIQAAIVPPLSGLNCAEGKTRQEKAPQV